MKKLIIASAALTLVIAGCSDVQPIQIEDPRIGNSQDSVEKDPGGIEFESNVPETTDAEGDTSLTKNDQDEIPVSPTEEEMREYLEGSSSDSTSDDEDIADNNEPSQEEIDRVTQIIKNGQLDSCAEITNDELREFCVTTLTQPDIGDSENVFSCDDISDPIERDNCNSVLLQ